MRLFCWNINGLASTVRNVDLKYGSLAAWFAHLDADIVCMQEVKLHDSKLTKDLVVVEGYQSYWACSQADKQIGRSGVTTWVRHGFAATSAEADPLSCEGCDKEGRALMTDHGAFVLFNVYVPNAGACPDRARLGAKLAFLGALRDRVQELQAAGRQVILVGDFNVAADRRDVHRDINWDRLYDPSELQALQALTGQQGCHCIDTWRHLHPDRLETYTVWQERNFSRTRNVGMRIDYALVSSGLMSKVQSCEVLFDLPPKWSDHAPLLLELDLPALYAARTPAPAPTAAAAAAAATAQAADPQQQQQRQQQQLPPPPECPMWQQLLRRFQDPAQRSIASMFRAAGKQKAAAKQAPRRTRPAAAAAAAPAGEDDTAAAAAGAAAGLMVTVGSNAAAAAGLTGDGTAGSQQVPSSSQQAGREGAVSGLQGSALSTQGSQELQTAAQASAAAAAAAALTAGSGGQCEDGWQRQTHHHHQQQQPGQQSQASQQQSNVRGKPSSLCGSWQPAAAGSKRKAASSKAQAAADPKQAKLHAFFARATRTGA